MHVQFGQGKEIEAIGGCWPCFCPLVDICFAFSHNTQHYITDKRSIWYMSQVIKIFDSCKKIWLKEKLL